MQVIALSYIVHLISHMFWFSCVDFIELIILNFCFWTEGNIHTK